MLVQSDWYLTLTESLYLVRISSSRHDANLSLCMILGLNNLPLVQNSSQKQCYDGDFDLFFQIHCYREEIYWIQIKLLIEKVVDWQA